MVVLVTLNLCGSFLIPRTCVIVMIEKLFSKLLPPFDSNQIWDCVVG